MIQVLLVDDHPMMRRGVKQLLEFHDNIRVVGEAASGEEAISLVSVLNPDMILLDLNMKGMSGIETLLLLREQGVSASIMIMTVSDDYKDVIAALRAGADGYVLKDAEPEELVRAILDVAEGQIVVSPQLTNALAMALRDDSTSPRDIVATLTAREVDVLKLVAKGYANKPIANSLSITEATVKVHVKNMLKKLQLDSRLKAAVWAVENDVA